MKDELLPVAILAGGLATRLRPITEQIPKSLIPINAKPFIFHQLELLQKKGFKKVVICAGFLGEKIKAAVENNSAFNMKIDFVFDGSKLLGTGGAIKKALPFLENAFFVMYGDSYLNCDYKAIQNTFLQSERLSLMTVFKNENQWDKSNVEFSQNVIHCYDKQKTTSAMQYIDYGLGLFQAKAFENFGEEEPFDLAAVYQQLLQQKQLQGYEVKHRFYEIGSFNGIDELSNYLMG